MDEEFLSLVIEMRKAQIALQFERKRSTYDRRKKAEKKVDDLIIKLQK